jgi:hypothetical protein
MATNPNFLIIKYVEEKQEQYEKKFEVGIVRRWL